MAKIHQQQQAQLRIQVPAWVMEYRIVLAYSLGAFVVLALLILEALDQAAQQQDERRFLHYEAQRAERVRQAAAAFHRASSQTQTQTQTVQAQTVQAEGGASHEPAD